MSKPQNVQKVINKLDLKQGQISFNDDETMYQLAPNVLEKVDFQKFGIRKGSSVEVGINKNFVNFLKKVKGAKKEETKSEPPIAHSPTENKNVYTLQAVAASKAVVKFKDYKPEEWIKVSEELQKLDFQALGLIAKNQVEIVVENDIITSIHAVKVQAQPKEEAPVTEKKKWTNYSSGDNEARQTSIESQAAVNAACQIVARTAPESAPASKIVEMVRAIAEANYQLIQDLKKK